MYILVVQSIIGEVREEKTGSLSCPKTLHEDTQNHKIVSLGNRKPSSEEAYMEIQLALPGLRDCVPNFNGWFCSDFSFDEKLEPRIQAPKQ